MTKFHFKDIYWHKAKSIKLYFGINLYFHEYFMHAESIFLSNPCFIPSPSSLPLSPLPIITFLHQLQVPFFEKHPLSWLHRFTVWMDAESTAVAWAALQGLCSWRKFISSPLKQWIDNISSTKSETSSVSATYTKILANLQVLCMLLRLLWNHMLNGSAHQTLLHWRDPLLSPLTINISIFSSSVTFETKGGGHYDVLVFTIVP